MIAATSTIDRHWLGVAARVLEPAYAGIRPKIHAPDEPIAGPLQHGVPSIIALCIESPGLTAALALAERVENIAMAL